MGRISTLEDKRAAPIVMEDMKTQNSPSFLRTICPFSSLFLNVLYLKSVQTSNPLLDVSSLETSPCSLNLYTTASNQITKITNMNEKMFNHAELWYWEMKVRVEWTWTCGHQHQFPKWWTNWATVLKRDSSSFIFQTPFHVFEQLICP